MASETTGAAELRLRAALLLSLLGTAPLGAQQVYHGCPMVGDATSQAARALNHLKNRFTAPGAAAIDSAVTLAAMLAPGDDHGRWSDQHGASIVGYVQDVKPGGIETTNCRAREVRVRDTHISLVLDPMKAGALPVIVEVTPRWRAMMAAHGKDWSTHALRRQLLGRWVRVSGWLMFDAEHANAAENTAPGHPHIWRATAWEVHPITDVRVVPRPH